ncbi:SPW repeat domain-containing protein [Limibacillus halophilus]|uniref:SPW repeat-containing integral membrane domain-containing protein n=1 Tax=Limibacillus halophilus TaxID=1579333 RepID=A0A839SSN0_9PROT|nr:hypothetical protein [Limibacillus halophilus]MBB3064989.1 hypothetical protein [Limibacillus halophilus]
MFSSIKHSWISDHHDWEDVCSVSAGVLIVLSPLAAGSAATPSVAISAGLAGITITVMVMLQLMMLRRWEELLKLACGVWVVVAPLLMQYDGTLRLLHFVLGGTVVFLSVLEFWQDRSCQLDS